MEGQREGHRETEPTTCGLKIISLEVRGCGQKGEEEEEAMARGKEIKAERVRQGCGERQRQKWKGDKAKTKRKNRRKEAGGSPGWAAQGPSQAPLAGRSAQPPHGSLLPAQALCSSATQKDVVLAFVRPDMYACWGPSSEEGTAEGCLPKRWDF